MLVSLAVTQLVVQRVIVLPQNLFTQPYFAVFGWLPERIALVYVLFRVAEAIFAQLSYRVAKIVGSDERLSLSIICLAAAASLVLLANAPRAGWALAAYVGLSIAGGLLRPFLASAANRRAPSAMRASVLSVMNMGFMLSAIIIVPAFGHIADVASLRVSVRVFQTVFLALLAPVFVWGWRALGAPASEEEDRTGP